MWEVQNWALIQKNKEERRLIILRDIIRFTVAYISKYTGHDTQTDPIFHIVTRIMPIKQQHVSVFTLHYQNKQWYTH